MPKDDLSPSPSFDPEAFFQNMEKATSLWGKVVEKSIEASQSRQQSYEPLSQKLGNAFLEFQQNMLQKKPEELTNAALNWWQQSIDLGQEQFSKFMELAENESAENHEEKDRRFRHELWNSNTFYSFLKEQYKLTAKLIDDTLQQANDNLDLDDHSAHLVEFYGRQWRDALSPSNYLWSNPEVLEQAFLSNGESLVQGLENLLHDLDQGRITMTPKDAFTLGEDIACTPGKVVFENRLFQLIQYEATTWKVQKTPLLIMPAWINKYYILDLQEKNSLVNWLVQQGFTVFIVSWVNPDESHQDIGFEDYLTLGADTAASKVLEITGEESLHMVGYCLGGTLLASYLAWLRAKKLDRRVSSATYLTTMLDFEEAGDLKIFIDKEQLAILEETLEERGYLEGNEMAAIFNSLRPQDLIWSFVINNYLLGRKPMSFDLLYWNGDVTRMPAKMHLYYLREMYLNNALIKGELTMAGEQIDLSRIRTPSYILATKEDHIAPWRSTYKATQTYQGPIRFVLSGSGHIAGVVNPPAKNKYGWRGLDYFPRNPNSWFKQAQENEGSWWDDWSNWLKSINNEKVEERLIKDAIEDAPGRYVKVRS